LNAVFKTGSQGMQQIDAECSGIEDRYVPIALGYYMYLVYAGGLVSYRF